VSSSSRRSSAAGSSNPPPTAAGLSRPSPLSEFDNVSQSSADESHPPTPSAIGEHVQRVPSPKPVLIVEKRFAPSRHEDDSLPALPTFSTNHLGTGGDTGGKRKRIVSEVNMPPRHDEVPSSPPMSALVVKFIFISFQKIQCLHLHNAAAAVLDEVAEELRARLPFDCRRAFWIQCAHRFHLQNWLMKALLNGRILICLDGICI
jgi:hypothetical protein